MRGGFRGGKIIGHLEVTIEKKPANTANKSEIVPMPFI